MRARPDEQYLGGELPAPLDLSDLDARVDAFRDAVGVAFTPAGVPPDRPKARAGRRSWAGRTYASGLAGRPLVS
jgi:hypothetical protein